MGKKKYILYLQEKATKKFIKPIKFMITEENNGTKKNMFSIMTKIIRMNKKKTR